MDGDREMAERSGAREGALFIYVTFSHCYNVTRFFLPRHAHVHASSHTHGDPPGPQAPPHAALWPGTRL